MIVVGRARTQMDGSYESVMAASGWVEPGGPDESRMYNRMKSGRISGAVVSQQEIDAVEGWIQQGAEND